MAELRVVFVIGGLGRGGSERQLIELISATHPERLEATVLTFSDICDPAHAERLRELGVELVQVPPVQVPRPARPLISAPRAWRALRRLRPDVVYAWLEEASTTVSPAAGALGVPVVVARRSVIGSESERYAPLRFAIRRAERQATLVTGNSEAVLAEAEVRGVRPERLRLVRNGHPSVDPLPARTETPVTLGYVANYRPEKGHLRLLDAVARVEARTPWRVVLVGAGEMRAEISAEISRRGLENRVEARGPIADVAGFWAEHDVAVLLSEDEGSPNALIEAAMLGRPLVGTDGGGTAEVIAADGGIVVGHEPAEIARALERLIDDPALRRAFGEGARRNAIEQHDLEKFAVGHLAVLEEAAAGGR